MNVALLQAMGIGVTTVGLVMVVLAAAFAVNAIKISVVEVKDVETPQQMQRAMARQAESERERRAKIIAAEGEYQASQRLRQAADRLESPTALQLRLFQTMGEIAVNQNSTIILPIPLDLFRPFLESQNGTYGQGVAARGGEGGRAPVRGSRQGQPGAVRARLGRTPVRERKEGETTHGQKDNIIRSR
ncbi:MAG TPA: hypothetical protein VK902_17420 [Rubrobacter sp.]|nr:hypothetical protein [Rubrobacter sp.]